MKKWKLYKRKKSLFNLNLQLEFLENLKIFLNRGFSLNDTLNLLKYRYNIEELIKDLENGNYLYETLEKLQFDKDVLLIVEIAETSGNLKTGITNSYKILKQKIENKQQLSKELKYPLLLIIIGIFAILFISTFLIPQFRSIYASFGNLDPTINLIFTSIQYLPIVLFLLLFILLFLILLFTKMPEDKQITVILKNKFLKKSFCKIYNYIFVINLVGLLKTGLKIDEIFLILSQQKYNLILQKESKKILKKLEAGYSLDLCLNKHLYDKELIQLIKEGETFSNLLHNLDNYMIFLIQKNEKQKKNIFFLIQPIFYGLFGFLILILYGSIFVPMFKLMESF